MRAETNYSGDMAATVARMHARYGRRLTKENYTQLISCTNVSDAAAYLKHNTSYSKALEGVDTVNIHRGYLEELLRRHFYEDYFNIGRFEKIVDDEFYNYLTVKTEIDEILICILHINAGTDDQIATLPIYMNRYTCFDLTELARMRSFDQLLELMKKTPYYPLLLPYRPSNGEPVDYRACELRLRTYYFRRLINAAHDLDDRELAEHIASRVDVINVINAYRLKKHFNADREQIAALMIPVYGRISEKKINELYDAADANEYIALLSKTVYGREAAKTDTDLSSPESAMTFLRYKHIKRAFAMAQSPALSFFAYHSLMEIELNNIVRIIEGIRYNVPSPEIFEMIISD